MNAELKTRIENAAKILGVTPADIKAKFVAQEHANDDDLVESVIGMTSYDEMCPPDSTLPHKTKLALKMVFGNQPSKPTTTEPKSETSILSQLLQSSRPIQQWSDEELLRSYIEKDQEEYEFELNKRAKGRRFIVLSNRETDEIDVVASLGMLKRARKEEIPSFYVTADNVSIHVYRIEDYHRDNRIRSESPLRPGVALFDDFCPVSNISFAGVSMAARRLLRLIREVEGEMPKRDEKHLVEIAREHNVDGLLREYPELTDTYMRKVASDTLPTLKLVENVASTYTVKSDPFKPSRHKTF